MTQLPTTQQAPGLSQSGPCCLRGSELGHVVSSATPHIEGGDKNLLASPNIFYNLSVWYFVIFARLSQRTHLKKDNRTSSQDPVHDGMSPLM